ncbi:hypothetical protein N9O57_01515 [bacterium]|nr:hypothetical protein [bacterium]
MEQLLLTISKQLTLRKGKIDSPANREHLLKAVKTIKSRTKNWGRFSDAEFLEVIMSKEGLAEEIYAWPES